MSWPSSVMRPSLGSSTPVSRLTSVVLPAPFGPIRAWRAPLLQVQRDVVGGGDAAEALDQARSTRFAEHDVRRSRLPPRSGTRSTVAAAARAPPAPADQEQARSRRSSTAGPRREEVLQQLEHDGADNAAVQLAVPPMTSTSITSACGGSRARPARRSRWSAPAAHRRHRRRGRERVDHDEARVHRKADARGANRLSRRPSASRRTAKPRRAARSG